MTVIIQNVSQKVYMIRLDAYFPLRVYQIAHAHTSKLCTLDRAGISRRAHAEGDTYSQEKMCDKKFDKTKHNATADALYQGTCMRVRLQPN